LFIRAKLEDAAKQGAPNFFGPQRFGRDGTNPTRALAWMAGQERGPRDRLADTPADCSDARRGRENPRKTLEEGQA
jgi:hypothetical protein